MRNCAQMCSRRNSFVNLVISAFAMSCTSVLMLQPRRLDFAEPPRRFTRMPPEPVDEKQHRRVRPLGDGLALAHVQIAPDDNDLLNH